MNTRYPLIGLLVGGVLGRVPEHPDLLGRVPDAHVVAASFAAAAAGALAEFVPRKLRIDDNLPIAVAAGLVLFALN